MHAFLASLMSVILFLQAVLGGCWHAAFGSAECAVVKARASSCCCSHSHHETPKPHKCELKCCAARVYLPTQKTLLDSPRSAAYQVVLFIEPAFEFGLVDASWRDWRRGVLSGSPPPLDLHLVHQVFVI